VNAHCPICEGEGWVCENHPYVKWDSGWQVCCHGAGTPCTCNQEAAMPPSTTVLWDVGRGYLN
jgi:hypothetical protein